MSMYITSGMASVYIQNTLNINTTGYQKSMEQLSSGSRFTSVGDDPIGVSKTAKVAKQISSNTQAMANVKVGDDLLTMTEAAQNDIIENLVRIRDLCVQAANGSYTPANKDAILIEIRARLDYVNNAASSTNFNGRNLLDGSNPNLSLQIGVNSSNTLNVGSALIDARPAALGGDITLGPAVTGATWTNPVVNAYISKIDAAITQLTNAGVKIGGFRNRLDMSTNTLTSMDDNLKEKKSLISDADVAKSSADLLKYQILQEASINILTQANQVPAWAFSLLRGSS